MLLNGETHLFGDSDGEGLAKLLELVDEGGDGGLGAEDLLLLLVEDFALGKGLLHLDDAVLLLAEGTESLVDEVEDRSV